MANDIFFYPDFVFCHNICYSRSKMKFGMHLLLCIMIFFLNQFFKYFAIPSDQNTWIEKETL